MCNNVQVGDWVIAIYECERFLGKVSKVAANVASVQCLEKTLGVTIPQDLERDDDVAYTTSLRLFSKTFHPFF